MNVAPIDGHGAQRRRVARPPRTARSTSSSVTSVWSCTRVRRNAASFSRLGPGGAPNSVSRLTPSVGSGENTLRLEPARSHQHQPARRASGWRRREPHRGAAAERVADQVHLRDAEFVEQRGERVGGVGEVVAGDRAGGRAAVSRLVDGERVEAAARARGRLAPEVAPRRGAGPAAVQQHHRRSPCRRPPRGSAAGRRRSARPAGGSKQLSWSSSRYPSSDIASVIGRPNSPRPNMDSARSGSLMACTRPACASRQNRWIGVPTASARPPEFSKSRSTALIAWPVPRTWSRRIRSRSGIGICSAGRGVLHQLAHVASRGRSQAASMLGGRLGDADLRERDPRPPSRRRRRPAPARAGTTTCAS